MIRLIASDIDGTLLPYGKTELDAELFSLIRRLRERGVIFCPASGRQYHSLRALFAPVCDELTYLCENGAILYGPGPEDSAPVLGKTVMERSMALEPMNSYERHVIHTALQNFEGVSTSSTGTEPNRRVVVSYERPKQEDNRPRSREWS